MPTRSVTSETATGRTRDLNRPLRGWGGVEHREHTRRDREPRSRAGGPVGGHAGSLERLPGRRPASPLEKALWGRAHRQPLQPGLMPGSAPALLRSPATPDLRGPRLFRAQYWLDGGAAEEAGPLGGSGSGLGSGGGGLLVRPALRWVDGPEGK